MLQDVIFGWPNICWYSRISNIHGYHYTITHGIRTTDIWIFSNELTLLFFTLFETCAIIFRTCFWNKEKNYLWQDTTFLAVTSTIPYNMKTVFQLSFKKSRLRKYVFIITFNDNHKALSLKVYYYTVTQL